MKIHTGDPVIVIAGKDKGKKGKVIRTFPQNHRVTVEGVNIVTRHMKPQGGQTGKIVKFEKPIDVSNVMIVDPKSEKPTRIGYSFSDSKKIRITKSSGTQI